jgi:hypothetical protein
MSIPGLFLDDCSIANETSEEASRRASGQSISLVRVSSGACSACFRGIIASLLIVSLNCHAPEVEAWL